MQRLASGRSWRWSAILVPAPRRQPPATPRLPLPLPGPPHLHFLHLPQPHLPRGGELGGCRWLRTSAPVWMASNPPSPNAPTPSPSTPPPSPRPGTEPQPQGHAGSEPGQQGSVSNPDPLQDQSVGLVQRFQRALKQYGKVMVPVHLLTSSMWIGAFYYASIKGVNLVPFLEFLGLPDRLVNLLENSQSGYFLTAYAMYKIATPARYTVTMGATSLSVKYLRRHGYMTTPPPMKEYLQDKMEDARERLSEKMEETKERFSERMGETKDKLSERLQDTKDKVSFRKKSSE